MAGVAGIVGCFKELEELPHLPIEGIKHRGVVGVLLARSAIVDFSGIGREGNSHLFAVVLQALAVAGGEWAVNKGRAKIQEERLVFRLVHPTHREIGDGIKWTALLVEAVGIFGVCR